MVAITLLIAMMQNAAADSVSPGFTDFERTGLWLTGIGLGLVILQLWYVQRGLRVDHDRRRKQATVEAIERLTPLWRKRRAKIEHDLGIKRREKLVKEQYDRVREDDDLHESMVDLLNTLEHLAAGVNCRVYDDRILFRSSATYLLGLYRQFESYITESKDANPTVYSEFVTLMEKFKKWRERSPNPGSVVKSP